TIKAQRQQVLSDAAAVAIKTFRITRMAMIKLGEVLPDHAFRAVLATSVGNAAIGLAHEPLWMFARERRVDRAMIDHQVDHDLQTRGVCLSGRFPHLFLRRSGA